MAWQKFQPLFVLFFLFFSTIPVSAEDISPANDWDLQLTPSFLQGVINDAALQGAYLKNDHGLHFADDFMVNKPQGRTIHVKAQKDDLTLFADYKYINPDPSSKLLPGNEPLDLRAQITELGASYTLGTLNKTDFEILAGTRYKSQEINDATTINNDPQSMENDYWLKDTFIGMRFFDHISKNLTLVGRSDLCAGINGPGFGWNVMAMLDYRIDEWGAFYMGYKLLAFKDTDVDAGMERYSYDALQQGPFIGMSIRW